MKSRLRVCNHQSAVGLDRIDEWLESLGEAAVAAAWEARSGDDVPLDGLGQIEVALVDDRAIGRVHGEFMDDPTATDVITFDHGEILIGVETGQRQAAEHGEPLRRELLRYMVHGLLHLAGHRDGGKEDRERMIAEQERIVAQLG